VRFFARIVKRSLSEAALKNRIILLLALLLLLSLAASSCGAQVSALENLCFAVQDFDLAGAAEYVDDAEGYFASVISLSGELSQEQTEIAEKIFSNMSFSDFEEKDGTCTLTVKYIDFDKLKKDVSARVNAGATATDVLGELVESKGFSAYMNTAKGVTVTLSAEGERALVPIGRTGVNAQFTEMLGLEAFLSWFTLQM
jgi:hypothetical protein